MVCTAHFVSGRISLSGRTGPLPQSVRRSIIASRQVDHILNSKRFAFCKQDLFEEVIRPDFEAYWVCKGPPGSAQPPTDSDVVVLHMHGGAYTIGHPSQNFTLLLRMAEVAAAGGVSVSAFALHYTLAPEATFPRPVEEAVAAYRYLIDEVGIPPSKILMSGESAGGHLILCTLDRLATRNVAKPMAAMLLFPWIDLTNSGHSVLRNRDKDGLVKEALDNAASEALGSESNRAKYEQYLDFSKMSGDQLHRILPSHVWVTVGTHDFFFDSITTFVERAREHGSNVEYDVHAGLPHGLTAFEDIMESRTYLGTSQEEKLPKIMSGPALYGQAIVHLHLAQ